MAECSPGVHHPCGCSAIFVVDVRVSDWGETYFDEPLLDYDDAFLPGVSLGTGTE